MPNDDIKVCSFCGKSKIDSDIILIKSKDSAIICNKCVKNCQELIDNNNLISKTDISNITTPSDIIKHLNQYVIGQDNAKEILSVAVYNHYKMLNYKMTEESKQDVELDKSNILLVGSSGVGKTYLLKNLAKILDVPFAMADASSLTAAGYVGTDVETIIQKLLDAAGGDIELAQKGIVFIDEGDKLGRKGENPSISKDVGGEGVQQALLKIIEGSIVDVPPKGNRKHPDQACIAVDTTNILFVFGGSFEGIDKIISNRLNKKEDKSTVGFGMKFTKEKERTMNDVIEDLKQEDLKSFGIIPELLGRLPIICSLKDLTKDELLKILTEPKNALIKQYQKIFELDNVKLEFEHEALIAITEEAIERGTGARSLRSILEETLRPYMLKLPNESDSEVTITIHDVPNQEILTLKAID